MPLSVQPCTLNLKLVQRMAIGFRNLSVCLSVRPCIPIFFIFSFIFLHLLPTDCQLFAIYLPTICQLFDALLPTLKKKSSFFQLFFNFFHSFCQLIFGIFYTFCQVFLIFFNKLFANFKKNLSIFSNFFWIFFDNFLLNFCQHYQMLFANFSPAPWT